MAILQLVMLMQIGLSACGKEEIVEEPKPDKEQMTIQIENGRYVNITGLSITSDTRVSANEEISNPEAVGVSSILTGDYEGTLHSGDYITIELEVDDPRFYASTDEQTGEEKGVQKFVFNVMDTNGATKNFRGIELKDGAYYIITAKDVLMFDSAKDGQASEYSIYGNHINDKQSIENGESTETITETQVEDSTEG